MKTNNIIRVQTDKLVYSRVVYGLLLVATSPL